MQCNAMHLGGESRRVPLSRCPPPPRAKGGDPGTKGLFRRTRAKSRTEKKAVLQSVNEILVNIRGKG